MPRPSAVPALKLSTNVDKTGYFTDPLYDTVPSNRSVDHQYKSNKNLKPFLTGRTDDGIRESSRLRRLFENEVYVDQQHRAFTERQAIKEKAVSSKPFLSANPVAHPCGSNTNYGCFGPPLEPNPPPPPSPRKTASPKNFLAGAFHSSQSISYQSSPYDVERELHKKWMEEEKKARITTKAFLSATVTRDEFDPKVYSSPRTQAKRRGKKSALSSPRKKSVEPSVPFRLTAPPIETFSRPPEYKPDGYIDKWKRERDFSCHQNKNAGVLHVTGSEKHHSYCPSISQMNTARLAYIHG